MLPPKYASLIKGLFQSEDYFTNKEKESRNFCSENWAEIALSWLTFTIEKCPYLRAVPLCTRNRRVIKSHIEIWWWRSSDFNQQTIIHFSSVYCIMTCQNWLPPFPKVFLLFSVNFCLFSSNLELYSALLSSPFRIVKLFTNVKILQYFSEIFSPPLRTILCP